MNFCLKAVVEFGGNVGYVDLSGILKFEIEPMDMDVLLVGEKTKVMASVKADAYGHGVYHVSKTMLDNGAGGIMREVIRRETAGAAGTETEKEKHFLLEKSTFTNKKMKSPSGFIRRFFIVHKG